MDHHLLVAISSHGFGHVAQVAPVVNALRERRPGLQITLRTGVPRNLLAARFQGDFEVVSAADDFGMVQRTALAVDEEASALRYRRFHDHWEERVEQVARDLCAARTDLILADVPYLTLAAAARAELPAYAMCSLNWAEIYRHYCGNQPESSRVLAQMLAAYRSARAFLRPAPAMAMPDLPNTRAVGPIAAVGVNHRRAIDSRHALGAEEKLVLVSLGGIATRLPAERWPKIPGVRWIFQRDWAVQRDDSLVLEELNLPFSDVLASCDLFLTKPGYGSFVEATAVGVPVLYVDRGDWPETACLAEWLHLHGRGAIIEYGQAVSGDFADLLAHFLLDGRRDPLPMTGVDQVAELLSAHFG